MKEEELRAKLLEVLSEVFGAVASPSEMDIIMQQGGIDTLLKLYEHARADARDAIKHIRKLSEHITEAQRRIKEIQEL